MTERFVNALPGARCGVVGLGAVALALTLAGAMPLAYAIEPAQGPSPAPLPAWRIDPVGLSSEAPALGAITTIRQHARSGVWTLTLSNGIIAHHRQMDGRVELAMTLSGGKLLDKDLRPEALRAAVAALSRPATNRLDRNALAQLLAGADVRVEATVRVDSISVRLSAEPAHAELVFELAHALLQDAIVDVEVFEDWRINELQGLATDREHAGTMLQLAVSAELSHDATPAFEPLDAERLRKLDIDRVRQALRSLTATCSIEVGIAGDLQRAPALEYSATYLGAVSQRPSVSLAPDAHQATAIASAVEVSGLDGRAVLVGFLGPGGLDLDEARALRLAADVLDERLKARIPDGEIAGRYEPRATAAGLGVFYGAVIGSSIDAEGLIRDEIQRLATEGPSKDELNRASNKRYRRGREILKKPRYWARALSEQTRLGLEIKDIRRASWGYVSIHRDVVRDMVSKYLSEHRQINVSVSPMPDR